MIRVSYFLLIAAIAIVWFWYLVTPNDGMHGYATGTTATVIVFYVTDLIFPPDQKGESDE